MNATAVIIFLEHIAHIFHTCIKTDYVLFLI